MQFSLLASMRVDGPATGGQATSFKLKPRAAGRSCKTAQYMIKIVAVSSTMAKVGLDLQHGPDGAVSVAHSTPIAMTQLTGTNANLLVGDADTTKILGEYLHVVINCISNDASPCWASVEIYEMRKPF
jgi:hypothetical protein